MTTNKEITNNYIEVKQCDLDLYDDLVKAIAENGPTISLIAEFRENAAKHQYDPESGMIF